MNSVTRQINGLQIQTVGQFVKLTKGQVGLLILMRDCVKNSTSISWDSIVTCYYNNVSKKMTERQYLGDYMEGRPRYEYREYDVLDVHKEQGARWLYTVRPRIRQWFVSTIGILVIKNQLIVIPTIDINDDSEQPNPETTTE